MGRGTATAANVRAATKGSVIGNNDKYKKDNDNCKKYNGDKYAVVFDIIDVVSQILNSDGQLLQGKFDDQRGAPAEMRKVSDFSRNRLFVDLKREFKLFMEDKNGGRNI